MKKVLITLLTLSLIICLSGCFFVKKDIYILYTSDVHSNVTGQINYANLKAYKDKLKKEGNYVSLIDGGDFSDGTFLGDNSKGSAIVELMNLVGYDYSTIGNHEFYFGLDNLKENIDNAKFKVLCANVKYTGNNKDPFIKVSSYDIKKYGSVKIAYIGITTATALQRSLEEEKKLEEDGKIVVDLYADPDDPEDDGSKLCAYMQDIINSVRNDVDYVVIISHLGSNDNQILSSHDLITYTNGIDLLLDGHAHNVINDTVANNQGEQIPFLSVGSDFERVGQVRISKDGSITTDYIESINVVDSKIQNRINELVNEYE